MSYRIQEPPNAIQIEGSEGCNLFCNFCGLQGIRERLVKNYKFMTLDTITNLAKQIQDSGWNPRVEWAMHGENTMNPHFTDHVGIIRKYNPKLSLMLTSNGAGFLRPPGPSANIQAIFDAGLNILALDDYKGIAIVPKIRESLIKNPLSNIKVFDYPLHPEGNPHIRAKPNMRMVSIIEDISVADKGTHSMINNHAGAGSPPNQNAQGKRCAKPFRELSIRWDGNVAICCNDWRGYYNCGNIHESSIQEIWNGDAMGAARTKLYHGQRDFGPCNGCDAKSYRVGLLPDKFGKESLPLPDDKVDLDIAIALKNGPYTQPVLRPWE